MSENFTYEDLYEAYMENLETCEKLKKRYEKSKKTNTDLLKLLESVVKIYCEDKSISELNSKSSNFIEVKELISQFIPKFDFSEYQVPEYLTERIKDLNQGVKSKRILMFTLVTNSDNLIRKHVCYNTNKECYLKSQQIHKSQILFETDFVIEDDKNKTEKLIKKKIITPANNSITFVCENIEEFKNKYLK